MWNAKSSLENNIQQIKKTIFFTLTFIFPYLINLYKIHLLLFDRTLFYWIYWWWSSFSTNTIFLFWSFLSLILFLSRGWRQRWHVSRCLLTLLISVSWSRSVLTLTPASANTLHLQKTWDTSICAGKLYRLTWTHWWVYYYYLLLFR